MRWEVRDRTAVPGAVDVLVFDRTVYGPRRPRALARKMLKRAPDVVALMFELDRRWGRISLETWRNKARQGRCPFDTSRFGGMTKPPFYHLVSNFWLRYGRDSTYFRAWEAWMEKNKGVRTEKVCRELAALLRRQGDEIWDEDLQCLYDGVRVGVPTRR